VSDASQSRKAAHNAVAQLAVAARNWQVICAGRVTTTHQLTPRTHALVEEVPSMPVPFDVLSPL
jgi:hypothetical protein